MTHNPQTHLKIDRTLALLDKLFKPFNFLYKTLFETKLGNKKFNYACYYGTNNIFTTVLKNLFRPKRILIKLLYNQIVPLPSFMAYSKPIETDFLKDTDSNLFRDLRLDGIAKDSENFEEFADYFLEKYKHLVDQVQLSDNYFSHFITDVDQRTLEFILDERVLKAFGKYYKNQQPYLRGAPFFVGTYPNYQMRHTRETTPKQERFNIGWHYDSPNLVQTTTLLKDLTLDDTRMQITRKDHRFHRIQSGILDYYYSDEFIQFKKEICNLVGKKGTRYLFDSNAPHRVFLKKDSLRIALNANFTPGNNNNVITSPESDKPIFQIKKENIDLSRLTDFQREALRYVLV